ncbi:MAG TPA: NAAT family transporter [Candidatus Thermoplasmatota archaeon]|nr:NAAT family transporter [Candidatus Thermoplasmatota archaeon]
MAEPLTLLIALLPVFVSLFAIVDPIAVAPVYLALTKGYTEAERRRVALKAVLVGGGVLLGFGLAGEFIFKMFGVTIPAFRIAGGILLFVYAFDMLRGHRPSPDGRAEEIQDAIEREAVGITPLGVPLLTGPGAIATMMVLVATAPDVEFRMGIYLCAVLVFVVSFLMLIGATYMMRFLAPSGLMVTTRLLGLILAAVAVQFVLTGITGVVDQYFAAQAAAQAAAAPVTG